MAPECPPETLGGQAVELLNEAKQVNYSAKPRKIPDSSLEAGASQAIVVLGMHRSGTSALCGSLREAGLYLGQVLDHSIRSNPKGLQEAPSLLYMHEDLLRTNGGSWDNPPPKPVWGKLHESVRDLFIESRKSQSIWGFKDPRTLFTLHGWLEVCPELQAAGIFRHPAAVAKSLQQRNGFSIAKGLHIWTVYNQKLLEWTDVLDLPIIEFSPVEALMRPKLYAIIKMVGLKAPYANSFYDPEIPTSEADNQLTLPEETLDLYRALQARAAA